MEYKVYIKYKYNDEIITKFMVSFSDEKLASLYARGLYINGAYNVEVLTQDGVQSLMWCKPIENIK